MVGVTGTMAWLSHVDVPGYSQSGLYGPANIDFRFVGKLPLQQAVSTNRNSISPAGRVVYRGTRHSTGRGR